MSNDAEILTYKDLAAYLKRSPNTLRIDCMMQKIPHIKLGRQVRFIKSEIDNWLESKKVPVRERRNG